MKRFIACLLLLAMSIVMLASCSAPAEEPVVDPVNPIENAIAYVKTAYKNAGLKTAKDFQRVGIVPVGDVDVTVVWTVDVAEDLVKIEVAENGLVTVNINEEAPAETPYKLTATVTDAEGNTLSASWDHLLPKGVNVDGLTYGEILANAYALEADAKIENTMRLCGTIVKIDTPYSADYKNITVTIEVAGYPEMPMM